MKKIRCPKCNNYITFDASNYVDGQVLVFDCPDCHKQFKIRIGKDRLRDKDRAVDLQEQKDEAQYGYIVVVENVFSYKQIFPLHLGDNLIGRSNLGTEVDIPIETSDPSMDRRHCYINVSKDKRGELVYTLRDNDSVVGTFLMNDILAPKDRIRLSDGDVITLGATSIILRSQPDE
ncbi:MAG TPA: FHA domain-containing protein [Candidatus Avibacteroides faecavium]|mgnify:CR=1 FL=1|nr:FHA domain-containing protein [Candidatus Avibacteroides faecavium]